MPSESVGEVAHSVRASAERRVSRVFAHIRRYREIVGVLVKYGFVDAVHALHLTSYRAGGRRLLSAAATDRQVQLPLRESIWEIDAPSEMLR